MDSILKFTVQREVISVSMRVSLLSHDPHWL